MKDLVIIIVSVLATSLAREINQPENFGIPEGFLRDIQKPNRFEDHLDHRHLTNWRHLPSHRVFRGPKSPLVPNEKQQDPSNENNRVFEDYVQNPELRQPIEVIHNQPQIPENGISNARRYRRENPERINQIDEVDQVERYPQFRGYFGDLTNNWETGRYFGDLKNNWEAGRISDMIQRHIEETHRLENIWRGLQALQPNYEKFIANPKVQKLLEALSKRGVDTEALDNRFRNTFGWNKDAQEDAPIEKNTEA